MQGPPGTGKTTFIAELIAQEIQRDPQIRILLTSQTHVALDHALEALRPVLPAGARMVRLAPPGDTRVDERVADLLLERQLPPWRREIRRKSEQYLERWAVERGLDVDRVKAAIMLRELSVLREAIEELDVADDWIPDDGESPAPASPDAAEEADANAAERAEAEADRQRDVQDLERDIRTLSLTLAPLLSMKRSQVVNLSLAEVERLYESGISAGGPDSTTLEGLIRLQSDWLDKAARGTEFDQAFLRVGRVPDLLEKL